MNKFNNPNETYTGSEKRPFRLTGIEKLERGHWKHDFVYLDKPERFSLILDRNEKIIKKVLYK